MKIGATYLGNGKCEFSVWAPAHEQISVQIVSPEPREVPLQKDEQGYFKSIAENIRPGTRYFYQLAENTRPDPAAHYQPQGVHGPSEVIDHSTMNWTDSQWAGVPLEDMIIYELHTGTFTPEGTFEAIIPRLKELREMGINAIEIMPIAQFPGESTTADAAAYRNWGYDGTYPFAVQNSYGGPEALKKLVDAAHREGISVVLDVVYNHFGPEGCYHSQFAPYFTNAYKTPWGNPLNFDQTYSYGVRNYFIQNALYWFEKYHIDALRLDAVHAIYDFGAKHILQELADEVAVLAKSLGRPLYLIAESDLNDVRIIRENHLGGYGLDAQWSDDFHHVLHTLLTGEQRGYYQDFSKVEQLAKAYKESFVYTWHYSPSRKRYHGSDASDRPAHQFVVCIQNHDQVGNRMLGERLTHLVSYEGLKLAAGALLLSPYVPMLFMGEEYGEDSPFLYFVSHSDPDLVAAVRAGRKQEFADFHTEVDVDADYHDPQGMETFKRSKLQWEKRQEGKYKVLRELYQYLIQLRRTIPALKHLDKQNLSASALEAEKLLFLHRWNSNSQIYCVMNFSDQEVSFSSQSPQGSWHKILDSAESKWMGPGTSMPDELMPNQDAMIKPLSFALYQQ